MAYDAELAALVYGLIQLHGRSGRGQAYTIFTDSTAAMRRITGTPRALDRKWRSGLSR